MTPGPSLRHTQFARADKREMVLNGNDLTVGEENTADQRLLGARGTNIACLWRRELIASQPWRGQVSGPTFGAPRGRLGEARAVLRPVRL